MLNCLTKKEHDELCYLLIIAFSSHWSDKVIDRLEIRKKAICWIRVYGKAWGFSHEDSVNFVLNIILKNSWIKKIIRRYADQAVSPKSSIAEESAAKSDLMSFIYEVYEYATGDKGLCNLRMFYY